MSVIVSGPRRVYVLLFLWRRVTDACASCPRAMSAAEHALGADGPRRDGRDCGSEDVKRHLTLTFYADREEARRLTREISRSGCACHPIYDFVGGLLRAFEATPTRVVLDDVAGQGIGSVIVVRHGEAEVGVPCYPPDGLALALRSQVPIYATPKALAHAERANPRSSSGEDRSDVTQWLEQVRPEDFSS